MIIMIPVRAIFGVDLGDIIGDFFQGSLAGMIQIAFSAYNRLITLALKLLKTSPKDWQEGTGWEAVVSFEETFIVVGSILATIYWLMGFIAETTDIKSEMRLETEIKLMMKLLFTDSLICGGRTIVTYFFEVVDYLIGGNHFAAKDYKFKISKEVVKRIDGLGSVWSMILTTLGILFIIGMAAAGAIILYMVFMRFFKLLIGVPFAAIASASVAGNREMSQSARGYWKYMFSTVLSAATMMIALKLSAIVISSGAVSLCREKDSAIIYISLYLIQSLLLAFGCAGIIKGSDELTRRFLGG